MKFCKDLSKGSTGKNVSYVSLRRGRDASDVRMKGRNRLIQIHRMSKNVLKLFVEVKEGMGHGEMEIQKRCSSAQK